MKEGKSIKKEKRVKSERKIQKISLEKRKKGIYFVKKYKMKERRTNERKKK